MDEELNGGPVADTAGEMSVADSIRAAFDEVESGTTTTADPEPSTRDDGRDQRGRFASKQAAETTAPDPAAETTAPAEQPAAPETETAPAAPAIEAPQHWAAADKERFAKLAPEGQQFLLERHKAMEGDYTRNMQAIAPLRKTTEQWAPYLNAIGHTPEQAFQTLLTAEYTLRNGTPEQKQATFRQMAKDYGITLDQAAQPAVDEYVDPQVAALNQKLAQLEAWKTSREQAEQNYQRQQMEQRQTELRTTIESFAAAKTEAGAPAHPHYEAVRETMAALIGSGQAPDLKTAYDMAVYANPAIRQQLLTAQQEAAAKKSAEEAKAKAQKASSAAASVSGKPVGATPVGPASSIREELERAWASARV
jgi:hypothetical protein